MRRPAVLILSVVALGVVASPLVGDPRDDSFPLSTYPMFASDRGPVVPVSTAIAFDADGGPLSLRTSDIGGTHEPVHAAVTVSRAIATGTTASLCHEIAVRVAAQGPSTAGAVVVVVTDDVDTAALLRGDRTPTNRTEHARCPVMRAGEGGAS